MNDKITRVYKHVPYSQLKPAAYNRLVNRNRVKYIKENYDPAEVRPVIVSFRDGKYYVIDGQHTSIALYELNNRNPSTLIYCDVRSNLTYEEESALFVRLNKNAKPIGLKDEIKGRLEAHEQTAMSFRETVEDCGYTLFNGNKITAISTAWTIFNEPNGRKRLSETLDLIYDTWQYKRNTTHALMIKCIDVFLRAHSDEYDKETFVKKLSLEVPSELIIAAMSLSRVTRLSQTYTLYLRILEVYNNRLRISSLSDKYSSVVK